MKKVLSGLFHIVALGALLGWPTSVLPQTGSCLVYDSAVAGGGRSSADFIPPVADALLTNDQIETALPCLIGSIKALRAEITSPAFGQPTRGKFNRATGAIQTIMANNQNNPAALSRVISILRHNNSVDAVSVLTYGLRGPDYSSRLNALVILGNIIDNTTVCVPIDHLYDPGLVTDEDPLASKWRANLLGVIAVPAPWAYKENYNAISRVRQFWMRAAERGAGLEALSDVLENIRKRLENDSNRDETLKQSGLTSCLDYKPRWANPDEWMKDL